MRGDLNHLAAAAVMLVFCGTAVRAQDSPEKASQEKASQEKSAQEPEKDTPDQSSGKSDPWYNKVNPARLFKHYKSANDQLASDGHLEDKLSKQLRIQGVLAADRELQDVCSDFKDLPNCVADSCAGPARGKAMPLDRALDLLKPNLNVKTESRNALKKAHDDIKDASS